jgi:hypothetical protein
VLLAGTCLFLALAQGRAADGPLAQTRDRAVPPRKLFPQITAGIENAQGQLVMNCQIAPDGLTVTDRAWLTFPVRKTVNNQWRDVYYYLKYFGFYNYHVLGMWHASQNKDIIEAGSEWFMPEFRTSAGKVWRIGDERYPSFCSFYKEPLVRAKKSADGSEWLVIACNLYNTGVQKVALRSPDVASLMEFELIGDYPAIKQFRVKSPPFLGGT